MIARFLVTAAALAIATYLVPGITHKAGSLTDEVLTVLGVAVVFGIVNAIVKPIFAFFTAPFILLTLGLFLLVINAALLLLTSWITEQIGLSWQVADLGAAFWGALIISIVSFVLNAFVDQRR